MLAFDWPQTTGIAERLAEYLTDGWRLATQPDRPLVDIALAEAAKAYGAARRERDDRRLAAWIGAIVNTVGEPMAGYCLRAEDWEWSPAAGVALGHCLRRVDGSPVLEAAVFPVGPEAVGEAMLHYIAASSVRRIVAEAGDVG